MNLYITPAKPKRASFTMQRKSNRHAEVKILQEEVLAWLSHLLERDVSLADVRSGVPLCELINRFSPLNIAKVRQGAESNLFMANENMAAFWSKCVKLGVPESLAFDVNDVTSSESPVLPRTFLAATMSLARRLHDDHGVEPPDIIRQEIEIELMRKENMEKMKARRAELALQEAELAEAAAAKARANAAQLPEASDVSAVENIAYASAPYTAYVADVSDPVDVRVGEISDEYEFPSKPVKLAPGVYSMGQEIVFVREIRGSMLALVGDRWEELEGYMERLYLDDVVSHSPRPAPDKDDEDAPHGHAHRSSVVAEVGQLLPAAGAAGQLAVVIGDEEDDEPEVSQPGSGLAPGSPTDKSQEEPDTVTPGAAEDLVEPSRPVSSVSFSAEPVQLESTVPEHLWGAKSDADPTRLIALLEFPHDAVASELGQRWFVNSGAKAKRDAATRSFSEYLSAVPSDPRYEEDTAQIEKDVTLGRTQAVCFKDEGTHDFLEQMEKRTDGGAQALQNKLQRVLTAFVHRNRDIGYVQGMNEIVFVLLGFVDEDEAFWLLATLVEDLRVANFYERNAPMMHGFQVQARVFGDLCAEHFTNLEEAVGNREKLYEVTSLTAMKWWIDLFIDSVRFDSLCLIFDFFFRGADHATPHLGADNAVLRASLTIVDECSQAVVSGDTPDLFSALIVQASSIPPERLLAGMCRDMLWFSPKNLERQMLEADTALLTHWNRFLVQFDSLARHVSVSPAHLVAVKEALAELYPNGVPEEGLTSEEMIEVLDSALLNLPASAKRWLHMLYRNEHGRVNMDEVMCCLAVLSTGTPSSRMKLAWGVFDTSGGTGSLTGEQVDVLARALFRLFKKGSHTLKHSASRRRLLEMDELDQPVEEDKNSWQLVPYHESFTRLGDDQSALVSYSDFANWLQKNPHMLQCFKFTDEVPKLIEDRKNKSARSCYACFSSVSGDGGDEQDGDEGACVIM